MVTGGLTAFADSTADGPRARLVRSLAAPLDLSAPPVVVRLAGLSAQALAPLTSPSCVALLRAREPREAELVEARRAMVEATGDALPGFDAAGRRFLLAVKRDCFNGRALAAHRGKARWAELLQVVPHLVSHILALEEQLDDNDRALAALHESELTRERLHVLALIEDRRFLRGVALASPGLVAKARSRAAALAGLGSLERPAKWEQSLLRFVTRAAAKLSANSTLTTYALGGVQDSPSPLCPRPGAAVQREVSLVRVNRPELEQLQALLLRHPAIRKRALAVWNDSLEEIAPGHYRFLRTGYWELEPGATACHLVRPTRVTVKLANPLLEPARDALREGALPYGALSDRLADGHGMTIGQSAEPGQRSALDQLVELGILILLPPWPAHEIRLEARIGRFLCSLPDEPGVRAAADALDELVALEDGFASAPDPERTVARMEGAFARLVTAVVQLAGHEGPLGVRPTFFEDVLVEPAGRLAGDDRGVLRIATATVREILRSAGELSRFAGLFNHRHDVLHTLAAWWRDQQPGRHEIPFTEMAHGFSALWKQFLLFQQTANESPLTTFDPLHTAPLTALRETRRLLLFDCSRLVSATPGGDLLPATALGALVAALPCRYAPLLGACVFVQPVDAEGGSWVLNRLHEGTGRYLSRLTPVLEESQRRGFLDHLVARAAVELEGEEADLLEVMQPWGGLVNAHPPQAAKVLDLRGFHLDLPRERRVGLGELTVEADLESETFRLLDSSGRRVLPVHLSSMTDAALPPLLRLLLAFGPGETRGVLPFAHSSGDAEVSSSSRLTCGTLVLRRRRWTIGIEGLRERLDGLTEYRAYVALHDWRRRLDLPAVAFFYERTYHGAIKPQYVDFDSPSLCSLFVSSLRKLAARQLVLEEALPSPADFPFDATMSRRGLELLIDSLAIRAVHDRESESLRKEDNVHA